MGASPRLMYEPNFDWCGDLGGYASPTDVREDARNMALPSQPICCNAQTHFAMHASHVAACKWSGPCNVVCSVAEEEITQMHQRLATVLCTKLVKSLRKYLQQLPQHLEARFTAAFEEKDGVRRPWNSDLKEDAARARQETARALAQLALVPAGFNVPGVAEPDLDVAQVLPFISACPCCDSDQQQ